jgi:pimeloyl-ACP methyl ester carboxylesterase
VDRITHRRISNGGVAVHVAECGDGPLVVLVHGMPELWYSWRNQLAPLAEAGYRAAALDLRGMGGSDAPPDVEAYAMRHLVGDVIAVLDAAGAERAVLVGHDWGANVVWQTAARHPKRIAGLVALGVPYKRRTAEPPTTIMENTLRFFEESLASVASGDDALRQAFYRLFYAFSGDAPRGLLEALFSGPRAPDPSVLRTVTPPAMLPHWLTRQDLDCYVHEYSRTGFEGVLNRYRNLVRDWEDSADVADAVVTPPALFMGGERDPAVMFGSLEPMKALVPALQGISILPGCGHWVHQERADEVNEALVAFVRRFAA